MQQAINWVFTPNPTKLQAIFQTHPYFEKIALIFATLNLQTKSFLSLISSESNLDRISDLAQIMDFDKKFAEMKLTLLLYPPQPKQNTKQCSI